MNQLSIDEMYMRRCLQLAKNGMLNAKPNPMVGAVIVCEDRIIGEGYHVRCGEGHAEVNAFASVGKQNEHLLPQSTIYVSLEPCSHYGKTPPCAHLIISKNVKRVVVGCIDPFAKVHGQGIQELKDAGINVTVGVLEKECLTLNKCFITYNKHHRPYIILKWAQTANGFIDNNFHALTVSTPFTQMLVHKLRSQCDAILVGRITDEREHPLLNLRQWYGNNPLRLTLNRNQPFCPQADFNQPILPQLMDFLYAQNIQSLLVEGGATTHKSFIAAGLWDEIRIEQSPLSAASGTPACALPTNVTLLETKQYDSNICSTYIRC